MCLYIDRFITSHRISCTSDDQTSQRLCNLVSRLMSSLVTGWHGLPKTASLFLGRPARDPGQSCEASICHGPLFWRSRCAPHASGSTENPESNHCSRSGAEVGHGQSRIGGTYIYIYIHTHTHPSDSVAILHCIPRKHAATTAVPFLLLVPVSPE